MKIKRFKFRQILKLHLLKSKVYEHHEKKNSSNYLTDTTLSHIIANFKKALQIIFQYHRINKRILFIGLPIKLELKINRLTNHVAVSSSFDLQGIISGTRDIKAVKKTKISKMSSKSLFPKLSKKPDLIVLCTHYKQDSVISESYNVKTPLVLLGDNQNTQELWSNYTVSGIKNDFSSSNQKNIFFLG